MHKLDQASVVSLLDGLLDGSVPFVFHFQPIVDLRHITVVGYEALVRFPPESGLTPDACFAAVSSYSRRVDLEDLIITSALSARADLPANCFLSVNLSPTFLLTARWDAILASTGSLAGIVIEITEQDVIDDYSRIRPKIAAIRAHRGTVAVDDAGSGYASLKHVMELKPNFVKLDRFFVGNCDTERAKTTLIQMIGQASDRLDAWIVAEGVETPAELDELLRLEVPLAQGYFLGRPGPSMLPLQQNVADALHSRAQVLERNGTLLASTDRCATASTQAEAESLLRAHPDPSLVVLLDEFGRPTRLVELHPLLGMRTLETFLRVQLASDPVKTLHRALTRPVAERFDPIAVIDGQGTFHAVVQIDRLMRSLLESDPSAN